MPIHRDRSRQLTWALDLSRLGLPTIATPCNDSTVP